MKRTILTAGVFAAALFSAQTAVAESAKTRITVNSDVDATHRSIVVAANKVCRDEYKFWEYNMKKKFIQKCAVGTVNDAVKKSGRQDLVAFHDSLSPAVRYDVARGSRAPKDDMAFVDTSR